MIICNNTHYFSYLNRIYNVVPDNDSWQFESAKRMSYSQRLYWEYKFVKSCGGQAFFYTFTYNNKSLPHFTSSKFDSRTNSYVEHTFPCFNYDHIRLLTNGIISKVLRRKYGSQLRYFVACERGEGKGIRGEGKNPHYHVIFFIFPLSDDIRKPSDVPYKRISPIQFCHLCKCVWQYNSTPNKYNHLVADYKSARFGHCQPGDDCGLITDFDALSYVSKYVVKDTAQTFDDKSVLYYYERYFANLGHTYHAVYTYYQYMRLNGFINSRSEFIEYSCIDKYFNWRRLYHRRDLNWFAWCSAYVSSDFHKFMSEFDDFYKRIYLPDLVKAKYREYVSMYGSKVRCSKSLGIYGLHFINDESTNPHFILNHSDEVKSQPICLYYFRKKYMDVVKCPHSGNPLYVLNQKGIDLKCLFLSSSLERVFRDTISAINLVSQANYNFLSSLSSKNFDFDKFWSLLKKPVDDLVHRFVVYRFVYQYRSYDRYDLPNLSSGFIFSNIVADYRVFLNSNFYSCDYDEQKLIKYIECHRSPNYISYSSHPEFSEYIESFNLFSILLDCYLEFDGNIKKCNFADSTKLRQRVNSVKYSSVS